MLLSAVKGRGRFLKEILSTFTAVSRGTMAEGRHRGRRCRTSAAQGGRTSSRLCRCRLQRRAQARSSNATRRVRRSKRPRRGRDRRRRGALMRREAAGEPPKGAAVITFIRPKADAKRPKAANICFYSPRRGNPAKREPQPTPNRQLVLCVVVLCAVAGWEAGECRRLRRKCGSGPRKKRPCCKRCGCAEGAPAGRDIQRASRQGERSPCSGGPRKKRPCRRRGEVTPQAARAHKTN